MNREFKSFNATTVDLTGSNLIEASAGTGKTYSVAILALRLVIEKKVPLKEILMVTFTKAAVAELEERIRLFIRMAYKASLGETISDDTIASIVKGNIATEGQEEIQKLLRLAVLYLDEISVLTIHGFCQQTLTEFAFETDQLFGAETLQDKAAVLTDEINQFWREEITTIPAYLLKLLIDRKLARDTVQKVVDEHLGGKRYSEYERGKKYSYCKEDHEKVVLELKEIEEKRKSLISEMQGYVEANEQKLQIEIANSSNAAKYFNNATGAEKIVNLVLKKSEVNYVKKIFAGIRSSCEDCNVLAKEIDEKLTKLISDINCQAINAAEKGLRDYMLRNNLMTFDDLIVNLHRAVTERDNPALIAALRKKYQAVFVDEFQDTDRWQYEIFHRIFGTNTILFYIGDPKQSIYAFRKADIHTYFKAGSEVEHRYTMDTNFRSAENFINAMNLFFQPEEDFDTFHFANAEEAIEYRTVHSPSSNKKGTLTKNGTTFVPITITNVDVKEGIYDAVVAQILELLTGDNFKIKERKVVPGDIGILVRAAKDGRLLKRMLSRYGIPAVNIDEQKILKSEDSHWLLYLLAAMIDISHENINKALLSPFTGFGKEEVSRINLESAVGLFRGYRDAWNKDGVYSALMKFISDFDVKTVLLRKNKKSGERVIANLYQLIELVHKIQNNKDFSPLELISWLQRGIDGMEITGDEYQQRVESDEDAIKIVTIHKSKGLEYNIVFAPFLDLVPPKNPPLYSYRDPVSGEYISIEKDKRDAIKTALIDEQLEQENRRLLYVAITRGVYACFLYHALSLSKSTLAKFLKDSANKALIDNLDPIELAPGTPRFSPPYSGQKPLAAAEINFTLREKNWTKMSYTMLAKKGEIVSRLAATVQQNAYDEFILRQLNRGNKTGNLLHEIFENISFSYEAKWATVIEEALSKHLPAKKEIFAGPLMDMLQQTMHLPLHVNGDVFKLSEISHDNRINEFEFDFLVDQYNPLELNRLSDEKIDVRVGWDTPLQGILNGKMDLFFGHQGKFYILDWKSNYLGDTLLDYSPSALDLAMSENNYHLQYLIYALAAKKYLSVRMRTFDYEQHFGGVIYLFIRGVRAGGDSGVFITRPSFEKINMLEEILKSP